MAADRNRPAAKPNAERNAEPNAKPSAEPNAAQPKSDPQEDAQTAGVAAEPAHPQLRVVRGEPNAEELAVLSALVAAATGGEADAGPARRDERGRWNDPSWQFRRPLLPGSGGWRAAVR